MTDLLNAAPCPACRRLVRLNRDGTYRRHNGGDGFDRATDGVCSWSNSLPPEVLPALTPPADRHG